MKKALVIDDDVDFLLAMEYLLKSFNYQLVPGTSSDNIQSIISRIKPAFVILDVFIGKEDGRQVYEEIKHLHEEMNFPIILCSGLTLTKKELARMPGTLFIQKPFSGRCIQRIIEMTEQPAGKSGIN